MKDITEPVVDEAILTGLETSHLEGIRVVEVGRTVASRLLVKLLGDHGAVISCLELKGTASSASNWDDGVPVRTLSLDEPEDRIEFEQLIAKSDMFIDALPIGTLEGLGAGYGRLAQIQSQLLYCGVRPFPASAQKAIDVNIEGIDSEWMVAAALGFDRPNPTAPPIVEPLALTSAYAAMLGAMYLTAALLRRDAGERGTSMEVSLAGAGVMALNRRLARVINPKLAEPGGRFGIDVGPIGVGSVSSTTPYLWPFPLLERYVCADGRSVQITGSISRTTGLMSSPVCSVIDAMGLSRPEWTKNGRKSFGPVMNAEEENKWIETFAAVFSTRTAVEWESRIAELGGSCTVCRTRTEWLNEPHALKSEIFLPPISDGGRVRVGNGIRVVDPGGPTQTATERPVRLSTRSPLPLDGVRVLDLCVVLAGPTCGRMLAELGADVVKIDAPVRLNSVSTNTHGWLETQRSKRSILLDLKNPQGHDILWRLIESADVLVENYREATLRTLGFGVEEVMKRNPRIVYSSLNCYDYGGPFTPRPGWELAGQAVSGMQMARVGQQPSRVPFPIDDFATGMLGAYGTLVALRAARETGCGRRVLGSLARTATFFQVPDFSWRDTIEDGPSEVPVHAPGPIDTVQCVDGWIAVARPASQAMQPSRQELAALDCAASLKALRAKGVRCIRIAVPEELSSADWIREEGNLKTWEHPVWGEMTQVFARGTPSGFEHRHGWPAPDPGADGVAILEEAGYSATEIEAFMSSGAVGHRVPLFGAWREV